MRILHIVGDSKFGGGAKIILALADATIKRGWKVGLLATDPTLGIMMKDLGGEVFPVDLIRRETKPVWDIMGLVKLIYFLKRNPWTIVHTHTSKAGFVGRIAARLAGVPCIMHTVHGFAFHEESSYLALSVYAKLERLAALACDRIITVSNFHCEWGQKLEIASANKMIAIPNGIPKEQVKALRSREDVRASLGLRKDDLCILSAGRLAPQKGLEYLIQAAREIVLHSAVPARFVLAGEGELKDRLISMTREYNVEDVFQFLGFRQDIGDLLGAADIVLLPSLREGLSIALLEAMAASKTIVATAIGSNREVIEHEKEGLLVPPKSCQKIADAVLHLASDPKIRKSFAEAANKKYVNQYTEEKMTQSYINEYLLLAQQKGIYVQ